MRAPRRLVFLDFDGVLNSDAFFRREPGADIDNDLDPRAVGRLDRLCREAGASVVVTSTWRLEMPLDALCELLATHGLGAEVVGTTPSLPGVRGHEIRSWLKSHSGWRSYVILDDRDDMAQLRRRLVQTTMAEGLLDHHLPPALALLSRRVWLRW